MLPFTAIWDTGATGSVIAQSVVDACGLLPTGLVNVHHAGGESVQEMYFVNIGLPNRVAYPGVRVTKARLLVDADVLIGMDIIGTGDFAVSNFDGLTKFSFRAPSLEHIDFVADEIGTESQQE